MKLYIKRDKSTDDSMFIVFDEICEEKYYVTGSKNTMTLTDLHHNKLMTVKRMPLPALKAYSISAGNKNIKFIMNNSLSSVACYFYGIPWHIRGDVFTKSFDIIDADNSLVATHFMRFSRCGDGYELNVMNERRELLCIGTAICVNLEARVDNARVQTV